MPINKITEKPESHSEYQATIGICKVDAGAKKDNPKRLSLDDPNVNGSESPYHFPAMFFRGAVKTPLALIVELLKLDLETEKFD